MPQDSFIVEELPDMKFVGFEGERRKSSYAEIEEVPCDYVEEEDKYVRQDVKLKIHLDKCATNYKFTMDSYFKTEKVIITNLRYFKLTVNDKEVVLDENLEVNENDVIFINKINKYRIFEDAEIIIEGFTYVKVEN